MDAIYLLILLLIRYHPSHASLRVLHIAFISWNQVDMDMEDTLSGSFAHVDAHIETVGMEKIFQPLFAMVHHQP